MTINQAIDEIDAIDPDAEGAKACECKNHDGECIYDCDPDERRCDLCREFCRGIGGKDK